MDNLELHGGQQIAPYFNVRILKRDARTGRILEQRDRKNRVTKMALMGIVRFINGEFNETTPDDMYMYIPHYLALGSNKASTVNPGVTSEVTVNDSKLLDEISPRILLTQRNIIENIESNPYIKLTIKCYIQEDAFVDETIGEAGLFSKESGANCWARIAFDPFKKGEGEVIDVTWEITVLSVGDNKYPTKINLFYGDFPVTEDGVTFHSLDERIVLRAEFEPEDATVKNIIYSSDNEAVATVDKDSGTIAPVGNGDCRIIASTTNNMTAYCNVHVSLN